MYIKSIFRKLSIKYKIILSIYSIIILVSLILGFYSYKMSERNVINKVSVANLGIVRQIDSNIDFLQREFDDTSSQLMLNSNVQSSFKKNSNFLYMDNILNSTINLIASKSYISLTILYSLNDNMIPYFRSNDGSNGIYPFSDVKKSGIYKEIMAQKGKTVWFPLDDKNQIFIENNRYPKIAMARMIRDINTFNDIGLLVMCVDEKTIRNIYANSLQTDKESIAIVDERGNIISHTGMDFYQNAKTDKNFIKEMSSKSEGYFVGNVSGENLLIAHSSNNSAGWKLYYAAPMKNLTKEVNTIELFTYIIIIGCLILIFPLMIMISSLITAPIRKLLNSMKSFQEGNFNEFVEISNSDEIGQLGIGFNNMVASIKELVNKAYILQIKEREAELNALQAQINPHFLYNTLDTVFWKAKAHGEDEICEMIYSLSRLFRLSLNRGKEMTVVSSEKELVEHYLLLQKVRFKNKLNYTISIDAEISNFVIPKLILQPFVENSILHGIEKKKAGGTVAVTGLKDGGRLHFTISDDGVGFNEDDIKNIIPVNADSQVNTTIPSGGYAVRNVDERLKLIYGNDYSLGFTSKIGNGTVVDILIPAVEYGKSQVV